MEDFDERLLSARTLSAEDETERSLRTHRLDEYVGQENVKELAGSGICGIAVISAIYAQQDIRKASEDLKKETQRMVEA